MDSFLEKRDEPSKRKGLLRSEGSRMVVRKGDQYTLILGIRSITNFLGLRILWNIDRRCFSNNVF